MIIFVVSSQWDGPEAVFKTRQEAYTYCAKVSGGILKIVTELKLDE